MNGKIVLALLCAGLIAACEPKSEISATRLEAPLSAEQIPNLIIDAKAEVEKSNFGRAIDITYRISKFDSSNTDAYVVRSQALTSLGNTKDALSALEAAFEHGLKDLAVIESQQRLNALRESPEYQLLIQKYGLHSTVGVAKAEIRAGNVSIKEEGGSQVIKAGDISITLPKD